MAIIDFPSNPSVNDTYSFGNKTWVFNGQGWQLVSSSAINGIVIGNITPASGNFTTVGATGDITASGNVQGQYILGNGAFLTGISGGSSYSNANVAAYLPNYGGNISGNVVSGNFYANSILPWSPAAGLINDAVDIGNSTLYFRDIYVGNVITPAGDQGNATQIQPASGVGQSGVAFVDAITGSATDVSAGSLYIESIDATGNVIVDTFVEANEIIALSNVSGTGGNFTANVTAAYFLGNGALLTGIAAGYSNANVKDYLGNFDGNIIPSANVTYNLGSNTNRWNDLYLNNSTIYIGAQEITANASTTVFSGNIAANYLFGNAAFLAGVSNYSNANVADYLPNYQGLISNIDFRSTSNTAVALVVTDRPLTMGGNTLSYVTLPDDGNANSVAAELTNHGLGNVLISTGPNDYEWVFDHTGNVTLPSNTFGINYANGQQVSLSGTFSNTNVKAYLESGATINANFGGGTLKATGTANLGPTTVNGNLTVAGNISATGNLTYINVQDLVIDDPLIQLAANNPGDTEDLGIVAGYNDGTAKHTGIVRDYTDSTWKVFANVVSDPNTVVAWSQAVYAPFKAGPILSNASITANANITATGNVSGTYLLGNGYFISGIQYSNITGAYSNTNVAAYLPTYTGNLASLTGNVVTSANVSAAFLLGNIRSATGGYGDANVSAYLASNSNITLAVGTGNITTQGNLSVGNLVGSGDNVDIKSGAYTWSFNNAGNLVLPANAFSINYANGTQVALGGSYSNSNVAAYLASNANIPITVGVSNITTQGNIAGNYFIGNGALLTGVVTSSYSNANVANYLPTYTGNISAGNLNLTGNIVDTGALQISTGAAGNIALAPGNSNVLIATTTGVNVVGYLNTTGNISVGNLVGSGNNVDIRAGSYNWRFDDTGNFTLPGNSTAIYYANGTQVPVGYANANVAAYLASNAAVTVLTTGNITTSANVSGAYVLGNGAFLSGLPVTYSNSNVAAYLAVYNGNALFSNITVSQDAVVLGNLRVEGNTTYINVSDLIVEDKDIIVAANASATLTDLNGAGLQIGNRTAGGNITFFYNSTSNLMSLSHGANIANVLNVTGNITATGNTTSGNVNLTGNIVDTGALTIITGAAGNITLAPNSTSVLIATTTGVNIAGYLNTTGNISAGNVIGSGNNVEVTAGSYNWAFDNTGNFTLSGNTFAVNYANGTQVALGGNYSNTNVAAYLPTYTGNISAGNVTAVGNVSANNISANSISANAVSGSNVNVRLISDSYTWTFNNTGNLVLPGNAFSINYANGTQVALGGNYSNTNVANYLPTYTGNVSAGNLNLTGNIVDTGALTIITGAAGNITLAPGNTTVLTATTTGINVSGTFNTTGNITGGNLIGSGNNVELSAGAYTWVFDNTGNFILPGNSTAIYYANGTQVPVGYANSNVASYLASNANVTIAVGTGNITTQGNITGNYFIGNGYFVTGIQYSNITGAYSNANVKTYLESGATINANFGGGNITTTGFANLGITQVNGNLVVTGNISATGNITYINVSDLVVSDPLIFLAANNPGDVEDIGIVAHYNPGSGNLHTGFVRDYTDSTWKVFEGVTSEPNTVIAWNQAVMASFKAGSILSNASITANANVTAVGNVSGTYLLGNGYFVSGIQYSNISGAYSNATVANYLASNAAVDILTTGNITSSGNVAGNFLLGNIRSATGGYDDANVAAYTGALTNLTGNVTTSANVSGAFLLGNIRSATGGYGDANVKAYLGNFDGNVIPSANITYSLGSNTNRWNDLYLNNSTIYIGAQEITANADSTNFSGNISATYILGNGAFLTGIAGGGGSYGNSNVADYLASNANVTILTTGNISTSANVSANNIVGPSGSNTTITTNGYRWSFNNAGNLVLPGNTFAVNYANGTQVSLSGSYSNTNVANYLTTYNGNALFSNITVSQDAVILGNLRVEGNTTYINVSDLIVEDKDIIVAANASATLTDLNGAGLQIGNRTAGGNITFFYNSTSNVMSLSHGANIANVLNVTGNITATGNVTGNNFIGNSATLSGNLSAGNVSVANGNITVGNLVGAGTNVEIVSGAYTWTFDGAGNLTGNGNISAGNFVGTAGNTSIVTGAYAWVFNDAGNLVLPGNGFSVNYANGTQVALGGSYSNSVVANYLASNAAVTILTTGNITTSANIAGNYFIGNGALLTGVVTSSYSNANVANYLPTYTGNVGAGNLNLTGNIVDTGAIFVITGANGNVVLAPNGTSRIIATGSGANVIGNLDVAGNVNANGATLTGNITAGNLSVANGNITLGNLVGSGTNVEIVSGNYTWTFDGAGNLTGIGNVSAGNFVGTAGNTSIVTNAYSWTFDDTGNLTLPGLTFAVNYANGQEVSLSGTYSNANVAAYLPTYTGNLASLTGNVVTSANVSAAFLLGNGRFITGAYGNADVLNYLQSGATINANFGGGTLKATGTANLGTTTVNGNLVVAGNISATGNITYINIQDLVVDDPLIQLAATNPGDTEDIGIVGGYNDGVAKHTGVVRDYTDGTWKVFANVTSEPNTVINWSQAVYAPFKAGPILSNASITANANITATGNVNSGNVNTAIVSATGNITGANFSSAGIVTATGNITGGNIRSNAAITGTTLVVSGNATSGNLIANYIYGDISNATNGFGNNAVLALLSSNTNYNITTTGGITANTVQAQYLYGNGTFITGLSGNFGNANLVAYGEAGWSGNIIPAANGAYDLGNNTRRWNDVYVNSTLYLPFQNFTSNSTRIIASSSLSAYDFISTNDVTAAANITATGNVSGSYVLGNIRFATGGYNDANVAAYTGALTNLTGNVTTTANVSGAYILGNIRSATGGYDDTNVAAYTGALTNLTGNVTTTANVQGAYVLGNGAFLTGIAASNYSNANVANYLPTYTGALPNLTGNVTTTANVQGGYILGNGYFLSGISGGGGSTYGNANVSDYLASNAAITVLTTANITTAANVAGSYFIGNGAFLTGITAGSSYSNANVADYLASNAAVTITTTANISSSTNVNAGNFSGTGVNTNIRTGSQLWTFGSTGILTIPGNVNANSYYINNLTNPVQDQDAATKIYVDNLVSTAISYHEAVAAATTTTLAATTGGTITYNQPNGVGNGVGATLTTTGSFNLIDTANVQTANTRILVKNEANGAHNGIYAWSNATVITRAADENTAGIGTPFALGINDYFYVTGGNVNKGSAYIVDAPNTAIVFGTSNIQFAIFSQSQVYSANTAAGISLATTTISAKVDNITTAFDGGGNISVKAGAILTTPNIGAATGTSLSVTGNITSSANISAANFVGGSASNTTIRTGVYNWTFGNTGNFTLPGNTFAVNYANGAQVSLGGSYSNADVANYLPTFTGNLSAGNLNLSGNIVDTGAMSIITGASGNVSLAPNGTNRVIATTSGANIVGTLDVSGDIIPSANITYSLGSNTSRWNDLYLNNSTIYIGTQEITANAGSTNFSGNVSGTYILGNGAFLTGIAGGGGGSYGNSNVADYLASNAAVTIRTTANITSSANVAAGNFVGSASNTTIKTGAYTWTFDQAGNLNINSASGTIVGSNANTTIQTGANRWNFASDGQLYLPGNIVAGYRDIPQISWTGTPTIALADLGEHYYTAAGGVTINIPANSSVPLPIGAAVTLINQSAANCTIARGTTTLYLAGNATSADRILAHYGFATLVKVAADTWFVNGANVI